MEPNPSYPFQFWADIGAGVLKMRNSANNAWIKLGLLGATNFGLIQPGAIVFHAKNAVPAGFLKCNGGVVPRNIYADLFAEIGTTFGVGDGSTTFNLPELRGEFLRGWDDGRGADAARAFGSFQADMTSSHYHTNSVATFGLAGGGSNITAFQGLTNTSDRIQTSGETRPRNVALLACIKY